MDKLSRYLKEQGISASRFARELGIQPSTLLRNISGKTVVSTKLALMYSQKTGISLEDLLNDNGSLPHPDGASG
jgi:transcriptional regulator with XRE-family HTH domain